MLPIGVGDDPAPLLAEILDGRLFDMLEAAVEARQALLAVPLGNPRQLYTQLLQRYAERKERDSVNEEGIH